MIRDFEEIPGAVLLSRQVEERIRKAITSGRMQPNVLYTETTIARQLGGAARRCAKPYWTWNPGGCDGFPPARLSGAHVHRGSSA